MTRIIHLLLAAIVLTTVMTGCKTTEANYRAAYEAAKEKKIEAGGIDGTIYDRIRNEAIESRLIVNGDSIPLSTVNVKVAAATTTTDSVRQYSIVVNGFKQIFNAKSMMNRLKSQGYQNAFVLETAEPLYYVVAASYATPEEAAHAYRRLVADDKVVTKSPYPWLLKPARFPVR